MYTTYNAIACLRAYIHCFCWVMQPSGGAHVKNLWGEGGNDGHSGPTLKKPQFCKDLTPRSHGPIFLQSWLIPIFLFSLFIYYIYTLTAFHNSCF